MDAVEAVREAFHAHYRRLVMAVFWLTGDFAGAEDIVQDTFARALARPRAFLEVQEPEAWLRTIAVNLARTRHRRRGILDRLVRTGRLALPVESVPGLTPDRVALATALDRLTRPVREAVVLHYLADLPVAEVARTLGIPDGTVKSRLSKGRADLARLLSEELVRTERIHYV